MQQMLVLINGPSGSGKSTLANKVAERLQSEQGTASATVFSQDSYFTTPFLPYAERIDFSYEDGSGIDWPQLERDMDNSDAGVNIVEGHMLGLHGADFLKNASAKNKKVMIALLHCPLYVCKERRMARRDDRTIEERQELNTYFDEFVEPAFCRFGQAVMDALRWDTAAANDNGKQVELLEISTEKHNSLDPNVKTIVDAIRQVQQDNHYANQDLQPHDQQQQKQQPMEQDEIIDAWPSLQLGDGDLHGFSRHETVSIRLDKHQDIVFDLECVSSLSPLDMVHLSNGTHDATGHSVWLGAYFLVEALASNAPLMPLTATLQNNGDDSIQPQMTIREIFGSARLLELGCGTGVAGLALLSSPDEWKARPSHVTFTDNNQQILDLCRTNCQRHASRWQLGGDDHDGASFSVLSLEWGNAVACSENSSSSFFDTVLATDVLYDLEFLPPLLSTVRLCLKEGGFFVLAQIPRSNLPDTPDNNLDDEDDEGDYHSKIEKYILDTASGFDLQTYAMIRPEDIVMLNRITQTTMEPLNSASLEEMAEAGAVVLVFRKREASAC